MPLRSRQAADEAQTLRFPHRSLFALPHPEFRQFSHGLRDFRSCKTSTGRVRLQMMRSPSQWPASPRPSMVFGRSWIDARSLMASREVVATRQITPRGRGLQGDGKRLSVFGECIAMPADASGAAGARTRADLYLAKESKLNILVNNAGAAWGSEIEAIPEGGLGQSDGP